MKFKNYQTTPFLILSVFAILATSFQISHAATFCVDDSSDGAANAADCDATCTDGSANCSLRDAITAANNNPIVDDIIFDIAGAGVHTISLTSALPVITNPIIIDGYTQFGASFNTNGPGEGTNATLLIELDGSNAGIADGITINSGNSTIRGLVINNFSGSAIRLTTNGSNTVEGNFLGTDPAGTLSTGNAEFGVRIDNSFNNLIGGNSAGARNLISGNDRGINIFGTAAIGNQVLGNLIGTDASGTLAIPNREGVVIGDGTNNQVGGTTDEERNIISGNTNGGISIVGASVTTITGNFIGTSVTGSELGNGNFGVNIGFSINCVVGGTESGAGNSIAFNDGNGVVIAGEDTSNNAVWGNSIFSNEELGIDLNADGVTPNDQNDPDLGPNRLQNFPILSSVTAVDNILAIQGSLNSIANTDYRIEFFSSSTADPSGNGEGQVFLGATDVTTDASGNAIISNNIPALIFGTQFISATATNLETLDTSEFSPDLSVTVAEVINNGGCQLGNGKVPTHTFLIGISFLMAIFIVARIKTVL